MAVADPNDPIEGGDAPDWLDEAAAMMAETPSATTARRSRFAEAVDRRVVQRARQRHAVSMR